MDLWLFVLPGVVTRHFFKLFVDEVVLPFVKDIQASIKASTNKVTNILINWTSCFPSFLKNIECRINNLSFFFLVMKLSGIKGGAIDLYKIMAACRVEIPKSQMDNMVANIDTAVNFILEMVGFQRNGMIHSTLIALLMESVQKKKKVSILGLYLN